MPRAGQEEPPRRACRDLCETQRLRTKLRGDSGARDHGGYFLEEGGRRRPWCLASRRRDHWWAVGVVGVPEMQVEQLGQGERSVVWVFACELGLAAWPVRVE